MSRLPAVAAPALAALSPAERLVVWGLRAWMAWFQGGDDPESGLREALARFGVAEAGSSLDMLLRVTARAATRGLDVRCVNCLNPSPDEALLLAAVAAVQRGDRAAPPHPPPRRAPHAALEDARR